jgi:hypothetical protein
MSETLDLIVYASRTACLVYFLIARRNFSVSHIVHDSVIEEDGALRDNSDTLSKAINRCQCRKEADIPLCSPRKIDFTNILSVNSDAAL